MNQLISDNELKEIEIICAITAAWADGELHEREKDMIQVLIDNSQMTATKKLMLNHLLVNPIPMDLIINTIDIEEVDQDRVVDFVWRVIIADCRIDKKEIEFLNSFLRRLNISEARLLKVQKEIDKTIKTAIKGYIPSESPEIFIEFNEIKKKASSLAERAYQLLSAWNINGLENLQARQERLLSGEYLVAVLGFTSTGKSTLLNALFGIDAIPEQIDPTSNVLVYFKYGNQMQAEIYFSDKKSKPNPLVINLSNLKGYISESDNPNLIIQEILKKLKKYMFICLILS